MPISLLDERFSDIDQDLAKKLIKARKWARHPGLRGDALADALGNEIRDHLVDCSAHHTKCEVRDSHDRISQEVDLVILNRFHPPFLTKDHPRILLIEGVAAAAEVKTSLSKKETIDCLKKARVFKRLKASVERYDLSADNVLIEDWSRYLERRPFFAFAYEDKRDLPAIQRNIDEWIAENAVPTKEQLDAIFVLNKGMIVNVGSGSGVIKAKDSQDELLTGFVQSTAQPIFSQLISWLTLVCPRFKSLDPILLKYCSGMANGYVK